MEEVSTVRELLLSKFDITWRGPCENLDSMNSLVDWLFGYPIEKSNQLSALEHEIEFGECNKVYFHHE